MAFFTYSQNNSGGYYYGPAQYVIVEAENAEAADEIARDELDLYFNGCMTGQDCSCCGDRWSSAAGWGEEGEDRPEINGQDAFSYNPPYGRCSADGISYCVVRYANGELKERK